MRSYFFFGLFTVNLSIIIVGRTETSEVDEGNRHEIERVSLNDFTRKSRQEDIALVAIPAPRQGILRRDLKGGIPSENA